MIGKANDRMIDFKFLHSAVTALSTKIDITVTDFLALSAFVTSEKTDLEAHKSGVEADGNELSKDADAYLDLLQRMAGDLSYTGLALKVRYLEHNQLRAGHFIIGDWIKNRVTARSV